MSKSYDNLREDFILNRDEKEYRHAYAEQSLDLSVGTQIKVLREQREWRQEDLGREANIPQPGVSRYENVNYSNWSINTLKKLARAFDVWLDVRFRSFGELVTTTENFSRESLQVPPFPKDSYFWKHDRINRQRKKRRHRVFRGVPTRAMSTGESGPATRVNLFIVPPQPSQLKLALFEQQATQQEKTADMSKALAESLNPQGAAFNPPIRQGIGATAIERLYGT